MNNSNPSAALLVIGNEILSGRTADKNIQYIAVKLGAIGVELKEARVIEDSEAKIIEAVNYLRQAYSYLFTTGGIGPTHDDITSASIAKALGVKLERNNEALAMLKNYYSGQPMNDARLKMADIPKGATLIINPVSGAPGFNLDNVFVMAGVPRIMQSMFDSVLPKLKSGRKVISLTILAYQPESAMAKELGEVQKQYPDVQIGSYPHLPDEKNRRISASLVFKGVDIVRIEECADKFIKALKEMKAEFNVNKEY